MKKNLNLRNLVAIVACLAGMAIYFGCTEKDNVPGIEITTGGQDLSKVQEFFAEANEAASTLGFVTKGAWSSKVTLENTSSRKADDSVWLTIDPSWGDKAGPYTVTISLAANTTGQDRTASVTLSSGGTDITMNLTQKAVTKDGYLPGEIPVTGVELEPAAKLFVGDTLMLVANVLPDSATNKAVMWASDNAAVASVDSNGVLLAHGKGVAKITVTTLDGQKSATCEVTVNEVNFPVTGVTVDPQTLNLKKGATSSIRANVMPTYATNQNVTWRSDNPNVATVSTAATFVGGVVTAVGVGTARLVATTEDGGFQSVCTVEVTDDNKDIPVTQIVMPQAMTLMEGDYGKLGATVLPENATNKALTWTVSDNSVVQIENTYEGGMNFRALKAGTAVLMATAVSSVSADGSVTGAVSASCVVTVNAKIDTLVFVSVTGVTVDPQTLNLKKGATSSIRANVMPTNATNQNVTWRSDNPNVATVSTAATFVGGVVTAVGVGTARLVATTEDGGFQSVCSVTVTDDNTLTLSASELTMPTNSTQTLTANQDVSFSSNIPSVVAANATAGNSCTLVSFDFTGTVIITATTADGKMAQCTVRVVQADVPVTDITLDRTTVATVPGEQGRLTATVLPENATNMEVSWTSSDNTVVEIAFSQGGSMSFNAVKIGTATITATTANGKTATCTITVGWGTVSFATATTWTVGSQTWSDAVQTTDCSKKISFDGGSFGNYKVDCRSNLGHKGDLFSWEMVNQYKGYLCPNGWRVPTREDFINLDINLGGEGDSQSSNETLINGYLNTWGGAYGGGCGANGLFGQGSYARYWSQSEDTASESYGLSFESGAGYVLPQGRNEKNNGFTLRCVK